MNISAAIDDIFKDEQKKTAFIADCVKLIEGEVTSMSFNAGSAYRAGLSQLKGIRPNYLNLALMEFVPEFAEALDPIFGNLHRGMDFSSFI